MKILHLTLKAKWYEKIENGDKLEEYREIKPYWIRRFLRHPDGNKINKSDAEYYAHNIDILIYALFEGIIRYVNYTHTKFSYGYTKRTMTFGIDSFRIGKGNPEWGAPDNVVFIIKLGKEYDRT